MTTLTEAGEFAQLLHEAFQKAEEAQLIQSESSQSELGLLREQRSTFSPRTLLTFLTKICLKELTLCCQMEQKPACHSGSFYRC